MLRTIRFAATLLSLSLPLCATAFGQSCANTTNKAVFGRGAILVSATELQIPAKAWQHLERAHVALLRNQAEIFQRESQQALDLAPRFGQAYLLRAIQATHSGRFEIARDDAMAALMLEPRLPWAGIVLAGALNQLQDFTGALAALDRLQADDRDSWQALFERARAETGLHHAEAALHWSELAVASAPIGCTEARLVRANAFHLVGRPKDVRAELERYLQEDREGTHHEAVLLALQRVEEADNQTSRTELASK